mmetsp:Transcript_70781/g.165785  ORF Transcript_70781/g.165785 Transcript_70781/m.165785 type:complete len:143 (+) Transcript_70781:95-523(+)
MSAWWSQQASTYTCQSGSTPLRLRFQWSACLASPDKVQVFACMCTAPGLFFYVELSEEAATALSSMRRSCETRGPCTEAASTSDEIVACAELAAAIEDAAKKLGRTQARVVNLKLERWCSIYGLHLQPLPFLRVEVADSRDD